MAQYRKPPAAAIARSRLAPRWARRGALFGTLLLSLAAQAQTSASGSMIAAPAPGAPAAGVPVTQGAAAPRTANPATSAAGAAASPAPPANGPAANPADSQSGPSAEGHLMRNVPDALPAKPGMSLNGTRTLRVPPRLSLPPPTMPQLPVIAPPRAVPLSARAVSHVAPVTVGTAPGQAGGAVAPGAGGGDAPLPGHLPEPVIDPSIGAGNPAAVESTSITVAPGAPQAPSPVGAGVATPGVATPGAPAMAGSAFAGAPRTPIPPPSIVPAAVTAPGQQNIDAIRATAEQYLRQQAAGLPGQVVITMAASSPRGLAACTSMQAFLPPGARVWGRTMVGVQCIGEHPWTVYLQARIAVNANYFVTTREIEPGQTIQQSDVVARQADLTNLPRSVVTDISQVVGTAALSRISPGVPLRQDLLRNQNSVQIGQPVKLIAQGTGFSVSYEGSALGNASAGESVRVRTASGQIVLGVVKDRGTVVVPL